MKVQKKLTPCPIIDALTELRFTSKVPANAVYGVVFKELNAKYPKVQNLPVLQFPEAIRLKDPNLKYSPYYKHSNNEFVTQVGPSVFSLSSFPAYAGWKRFSEEIFNCINLLKKLEFIDRVERFGIRYVNRFDFEIIGYTNFRAELAGSELAGRNTFVRTEYQKGEFISLLQMGNNILPVNDAKNRLASVIDIDTSIADANALKSFLSNPAEIVEKSHNLNKELFYTLLNEKISEKIKCEEM